nr:hypothetical protein [Acetobacter persici]
MMSVVFPDWMPLWAQLLVIALVIVFGLAFLMMPFAVFGVKGRLMELELQTREMQAELRAMAMRLAAGQGAAQNRPPMSAGVPEGVQVEEIYRRACQALTHSFSTGADAAADPKSF